MSSNHSQKTGDRAGAGERREDAFTLIELLAVIVVIALLASLIVPLTAMAVRNMKVARVSTELKDLEVVIKNYKETKGFYPPDNPNSFATNQLFYELNGSISYYDSGPKDYEYFPMYNTNIVIKAADITAMYGVGVEGFVNASQNPSENPVFRHDFTQKQTIDLPALASGVSFKQLVCTVHNPDGTLVPWNYNSTNPTNNPTSFDLWVDLTLRGRTNRFCNWSSTPIVL